MTEQEMQFELMKSQEEVNALRQEVADMNKEREYWQHYRIQAAIAAMQGMLANPQTFEQIDHDKGYKEVCDGDKTKIVARASVMYADALTAELKRSDDVYAECRRMDAINTASVCENMTKIQKELQKKGGQDENPHRHP
jgi:hypothetical protein